MTLVLMYLFGCDDLCEIDFGKFLSDTFFHSALGMLVMNTAGFLFWSMILKMDSFHDCLTTYLQILSLASIVGIPTKTLLQDRLTRV